MKIAIVGVSHDPNKYGYKIFSDLIKKKEYQVYGVNPKGGQLAGQSLYTSLRLLPEVPDTVMTVVPPKVTEKVVEECHHLGISTIWMQPGSESETAIKKAENYGIEVIAHVCFMVDKGLW